MAQSCYCGEVRVPLGLPVTQLVNEGAEPALDFVFAVPIPRGRLSPPPALAEARDLLLKHFAEPSDSDARRAQQPARIARRR